MTLQGISRWYLNLLFSLLLLLHIIFSGFMCANQILMSLQLCFVAFYNCRSNNFMIGWHIGTKTSQMLEAKRRLKSSMILVPKKLSCYVEVLAQVKLHPLSWLARCLVLRLQRYFVCFKLHTGEHLVYLFLARISMQLPSPVHCIQVNASDNRGKSDAKVQKGIGGSNANSIKELISNESLHFRMDQLVCIS